MKHLPIYLSCFCFCLQPAYADDEEDFEVQEEGMFFDHARTGLLYKRTDYLPEDTSKIEAITYVPYFPTAYNDTRDQVPGLVYVTHWEQDPPSFVTVYLLNDSAQLTSKHEIDFEISIGHYDRAKNIVVANRKVVTGIVLEKGINRVPVNIHNYKGDIVQVRLQDQRFKYPILPIEFKND